MKTILVTLHRRENFGKVKEVFESLITLSRIAKIKFIIHPNPNVVHVAKSVLWGKRNIVLVEPVGYKKFVKLIKEAYLILTDSGDVQEEAPTLKKPVLVMRNKTERYETIE